jgi:hypothetical protein
MIQAKDATHPFMSRFLLSWNLFWGIQPGISEIFTSTCLTECYPSTSPKKYLPAIVPQQVSKRI